MIVYHGYVYKIHRMLSRLQYLRSWDGLADKYSTRQAGDLPYGWPLLDECCHELLALLIVEYNDFYPTILQQALTTHKIHVLAYYHSSNLEENARAGAHITG